MVSECVSKLLLVRQPTKLINCIYYNVNKNMDNLNLVVGLPLYYISWVWAFSSENTLFIFNKYINTIAILCSITDISRITYTCFFSLNVIVLRWGLSAWGEAWCVISLLNKTTSQRPINCSFLHQRGFLWGLKSALKNSLCTFHFFCFSKFCGGINN